MRWKSKSKSNCPGTNPKPHPQATPRFYVAAIDVLTEPTISGLWCSNDPRPSPDFSPRLGDKIWGWPWDEATSLSWVVSGPTTEKELPNNRQPSQSSIGTGEPCIGSLVTPRLSFILLHTIKDVLVPCRVPCPDLTPLTWGKGSSDTSLNPGVAEVLKPCSCWYRITSCWSVLRNEYHNITTLSGTIGSFSSALSQIFHSLSRTGGNCFQAFGVFTEANFLWSL